MTGLPDNWAEIPLGKLTAKTKSLNPASFPNERFELYSVPSFANRQPEQVCGREIKSNKQRVEPGDVLLCKIVPHLNRVWVVSASNNQNQIASGEWIVHRTDHCDPYYLRHLLSAPEFRESFLATVSGVGGSLMRARPAAVKTIEIPLAPLREQRRIVAKLDSLSARSSRARHELDCIPRLIESYKQAILAKAFSGELTSDWRSQHGLPQWGQDTAGSFFLWASGKFLPKSDQAPGEIPVFGGNGKTGNHNCALVREPTIVIGRVGAQCGNVHLTCGPAWVTDNAIYASSVAPSVDLRFALLAFRHAELNTAAGGSGQPFVNQTILNQTEFPRLDLREQREIVRRTGMAGNRDAEQARLLGDEGPDIVSEAISAVHRIDKVSGRNTAKGFDEFW